MLAELPSSLDSDRWSGLRRLAGLTALKKGPDGSFSLAHWWRGPVLYSLVQQNQPRHILEVGMGRGYGALCMAQALMDGGLPGTIWTIDLIPPMRPQQWAMDQGNGPEYADRSCESVWGKYVSPQVRDRIHCITGSSHAVLRNWRQKGLPSIDFCFVDAHHDYWSVKEDLIQVLRIIQPGAGILFDDYTDRKGFGVRRLLNKEIIPKLPKGAVEIIETFSQDHTLHGDDVPHQLALIRKGYLSENPLNQFYTSGQLREFALGYFLVSTCRSITAPLRPYIRRLLRIARFLMGLR